MYLVASVGPFVHLCVLSWLNRLTSLKDAVDQTLKNYAENPQNVRL